MSFYKFIEKKYFDDFFQTGSIRLGTLYNFQMTEKHGMSRGDTTEGKHTVYRKIDDNLLVTNDNIKSEPMVSDFFGIEASSRGGFMIEDILLQTRHTSPNMLIFCSSNPYSSGLFSKWYEKEKLDYCYEIFDVVGFCTAITHALSTRSEGNKFRICKKVIYANKNINHDSAYAKEPPCILKKKEHQWQNEMRMAWSFDDASKDQEVIIMDVPEAVKFCRKYAFIEKNKIHYFSKFGRYFR